MASNTSRLVGLLFAAVATAYGCSDGSALVAPETQQGPARGLLTGLIGSVVTTTTDLLTPVTVLKRSTPLSADVSVTAPIGKDGGTIEIPEAGIRVVFPRNALTPPKSWMTYDITVTALKGDAVAYTFEPHGLTFREPVRIEQTIRGTSAEINLLQRTLLEGAYFPRVSDLDTSQGTANVSEFLPTVLDLTGTKVRFSVEHFSGYLIASGRAR